LEDAIEWHQQHASPTSDHSRHSGSHLGRSGEVEFSTIEAIDAGELDGRARNVIPELPEGMQKLGFDRLQIGDTTTAIARALIPTLNHPYAFDPPRPRPSSFTGTTTTHRGM
jgi:hypothetical protein